jgi:Xaa-Pro aminopeptidase
MTVILIHDDTYRSPDLRREVPLDIGDAFLYVERDGERHVQVPSLEAPRLAKLGRYVVHVFEEYGYDRLLADGMSRFDALDELARRAVRALGVTRAVVPARFPVRLADVLRADGVELRVDHDLFADRRRTKNAAELRGIRRAQRAAEAGNDAARALMRRATPGPGGLEVDGLPLTCELIKAAIAQALAAHPVTGIVYTVAHGAQAAIPHDRGTGQLQTGETVVIDLGVRDNESACHADMTRTYVVGDVPEGVAAWFALVKEALDRSMAEIRPGASGRAPFAAACDVFEPAGYATRRTAPPGTALDTGFTHALGHGVGLQIHEPPSLSTASRDTLRAGDVVTVEPGLYRPGVGGLRLEDLVLVTSDGAENLTRYPYDLQP